MVFLGKSEFVGISFDMRFKTDVSNFSGFCQLIFEEGFSFCLLYSGFAGM